MSRLKTLIEKHEDYDEYDVYYTEEEGGEPGGTTLRAAYSKDGGYIGRVEDAEQLVERGIVPELVTGKNTCSIGFCALDQKWYGWSHRAMYGFTIGDKVKKGDSTASSRYTEEYLKEHPEDDQSLSVGFEAKTLDDAKRMAVAFADSVS